MTDQSTLDAIRRRREAISLGPWRNVDLPTEDDARFVANAPADIDYLLSLVAGLQEVLKPFANYVDMRGSGMPDDSPMSDWLGNRSPTLGDCRAARKALEDSR